MSSTFFVRRDRPAVVANIVRAVGPIAWADGELAGLDVWPERSLLLYLPGESSRGVEVVRDGDEYRVRVLALSTKADYELAFSLVEALGGTSAVTIEPDGSARADEIRARCGGDWMVRDMATGIVAVKTSLEAGNTVTITGPVASVELEPRALADAAQWPEILRQAQVAGPPVSDWDRVRAELDAGDDDHFAKLREQEPPAPKRPTGGYMLAFVPVFLVVLVPALVTRVVTWPFRARIRERRVRRSDDGERARAAVIDASDKLRASPDDVDLRHQRALRLLEMGWRSAADRELVACLDRLAAGAKATVTPDAIHYHLYIARTRMGLPGLAKRSLDAAEAAGLEVRLPSWPRRAWHAIAKLPIAVAALFILIAGLDPD